ncbi:unnamed protein product [Amaranthus hypochondriacus]
MARNNKTTFLPTRHIKLKLLLRGKSKEFSSQTRHIINKIMINPMINHLKNPPLFTSIHYFPTNFTSFFSIFINSCNRNNGYFTTKLIISNLWPFIFITNKGWIQSSFPF